MQTVDTLVLATGGGGIQTAGGTVVVAADGTLDSQKQLFNDAVVVTASGWVPATTGTTNLATNLSAKKFYIPLGGLRVGDQIVSFSIKGALSATGGAATVIDADLRKVTGAADAVTDASVGAITQVSVTADAALNASKTFAATETVATGFQYYVLVTGTTANDAACTAQVIGVELTVNKVV